MTRYDQQILFTALAFIAVVLKDGENLQEGSGQKIKILAELLGDFCMDKVPAPFDSSIGSPSGDSKLTKINEEVKAREGLS